MWIVSAWTIFNTCLKSIGVFEKKDTTICSKMKEQVGDISYIWSSNLPAWTCFLARIYHTGPDIKLHAYAHITKIKFLMERQRFIYFWLGKIDCKGYLLKAWCKNDSSSDNSVSCSTSLSLCTHSCNEYFILALTF